MAEFLRRITPDGRDSRAVGDPDGGSLPVEDVPARDALAEALLELRAIRIGLELALEKTEVGDLLAMARESTS